MPDCSTRMGRKHDQGSKADNEGKAAPTSSYSTADPDFKRPIDPRRVLQILECKRRVLDFVESMLEPEVTLEQLRAGEELICRLDYDSIAQERHILKTCGYPLCSNKLVIEWKQRYHVSLKDKRIYDVEILKLYCNVNCMDMSLKYRNEHVPEQPVWMRLDDIKMGLDKIETHEEIMPEK